MTPFALRLRSRVRRTPPAPPASLAYRLLRACLAYHRARSGLCSRHDRSKHPNTHKAMYRKLSLRFHPPPDELFFDFDQAAQSLPVLVEIDRPDTKKPAWLQSWDGTSVTTTRLPTAPPNSGELTDWGATDLLNWTDHLAQFDPDEATGEMIHIHFGNGFPARHHRPPPNSISRSNA